MAADGDETLTEKWELFFQALLDVLDDYEQFSNSVDALVRENLLARLEYVVFALHHVLPFASGDCEAFLQELSRNFRLLVLEWSRGLSSSTQCTNVAIYSLESPSVAPKGSPGRPKLQISEDVLLELRSLGFKWKDISEMLLVSRWTVRRRVVEYGLEETTGFSALTNDELDTYVRQFMEQHGSMVGCSMLSGYLRSLGLRIQRDRLRASIARVDPSNVRIRWAAVICRRSYSVPGPNSLWHLDGHHSLVNWGFVIHGGIDGFSRLIVFLKCSTNNKSDTVRDLFLSATEQYHWPSRVRTDLGGENVRVWDIMEEVRGSNRGSYLAGTSVHNQRIERLWRDVFCNVCHIFYYTFQALEQTGLIQRDNRVHMYVLHYVFLPRINKAIESFGLAWNHHPMRTERNWSPLKMWANGMLDIRNHGCTGVSDVAGSDQNVDDLQWFGYDPNAPSPSDDGLSTVEVDDVNVNLPDTTIDQLIHNIDPLAYSDSFGIDIYLQALSLVSDIRDENNS